MSSSRSSSVEVAAVERRALGRGAPWPGRGRPPRRRATCRCLAALRRFSIWFSTVSRSARASSISTMPQVLERVGRAGDVVVGEGPQHEHDGVDLADVGQELVAQALALAGPLDQAADVDELHAWRARRSSTLAHLGQARRGGGRAPWPCRRWGRWWRRRRARPARRRRRGRCTARTCPHWGGRRTRSVPSGGQGSGRRGAPVGVTRRRPPGSALGVGLDGLLRRP